jgi:hypothetical protein
VTVDRHDTRGFYSRENGTAVETSASASRA